MSSLLFRHEALSARHSEWVDSIVMRRLVPVHIAAAVAMRSLSRWCAISRIAEHNSVQVGRHFTFKKQRLSVRNSVVPQHPRHCRDLKWGDLKDVEMQELNVVEIEEVGGGLPYLTPALIALGDTASLGPLVWAFGIGYGIGTLAYNYYSG